MDRSLHGDKILWVDYDAAIALHRVVGAVPLERRLQRLNGRSPLDRRITYGCINVSAKFFDEVVIPAFEGSKGVVYVLPETRSPREVFGSYDVDEQAAPRDGAHVHGVSPTSQPVVSTPPSTSVLNLEPPLR